MRWPRWPTAAATSTPRGATSPIAARSPASTPVWPARIERLIGHPAPRPPSVEAEPYLRADQFRADLVAIAHSLGMAGGGLLATGGALGRLIRAVETCGFHLATLDLRQNSDVHARVVADLLKVAGVEQDYLALDEPSREALLRRELASERPLASPFVTYAEETASELAIVRAAAEAHARYGPASITTYIVSKCDSVSDLLEVQMLLKEAGLYRAARSGGVADHGRAAVRDDPRPGRRRSHHAGVAVAPGRVGGGAVARLSGSDGRLLRLQQGWRLSHLGVEPAPGDAGARAGVRRGAGGDAGVSRTRRSGRARRRVVVRGDPRATGRHGAGPYPDHRTGRSDRGQVRHAREHRVEPGGDDRGDAARLAGEAGGAGGGCGAVRGRDGDAVARRVSRLSRPGLRDRGVQRRLPPDDAAGGDHRAEHRIAARRREPHPIGSRTCERFRGCSAGLRPA